MLIFHPTSLLTQGRRVVLMASCTISPGQEVTDIYSQCYYDQARADRAAKCAEYRSGVQYRVCRVISLPGVQYRLCRVISTGCTVLLCRVTITGCAVQVLSCYHYRVLHAGSGAAARRARATGRCCTACRGRCRTRRSPTSWTMCPGDGSN